MTRNWDLLDLWACRGGRTDDIDHTEENWRKMRRWYLDRLKRRARVENARLKVIQSAKILPPVSVWNAFTKATFNTRIAMNRYEEVAKRPALNRVMRRIWGITTTTAKPSQQSLEI